MSQMIASILLVLLGLFIGVFIVIVLNNLRATRASKKIETLLEQAKKDAEKIKRDYILDAKEEAHKLKIDTEKEEAALQRAAFLYVPVLERL